MTEFCEYLKTINPENETALDIIEALSEIETPEITYEKE